jgi:hypothetical protein
VPLAVKNDKPPDPPGVALLGSEAVVFAAKDLADGVEQPWGGRGRRGSVSTKALTNDRRTGTLIVHSD